MKWYRALLAALILWLFPISAAAQTTIDWRQARERKFETDIWGYKNQTKYLFLLRSDGLAVVTRPLSGNMPDSLFVYRAVPEAEGSRLHLTGIETLTYDCNNRQQPYRCLGILPQPASMVAVPDKQDYLFERQGIDRAYLLQEQTYTGYVDSQTAVVETLIRPLLRLSQPKEKPSTDTKPSAGRPATLPSIDLTRLSDIGGDWLIGLLALPLLAIIIAWVQSCGEGIYTHYRRKVRFMALTELVEVATVALLLATCEMTTRNIWILLIAVVLFAACNLIFILFLWRGFKHQALKETSVWQIVGGLAGRFLLAMLCIAGLGYALHSLGVDTTTLPCGLTLTAVLLVIYALFLRAWFKKRQFDRALIIAYLIILPITITSAFILSVVAIVATIILHKSNYESESPKEEHPYAGFCGGCIHFQTRNCPRGFDINQPLLDSACSSYFPNKK